MREIFYKLFYMLSMLFLISLISFFAIKLAPNSFLSSGELNPNISAESLNALKEIYGLDKPLFNQYISWAANISKLEFGISFASGKSVKEEILSRLPVTLAINLISMFLIFTISLLFGIMSALKFSKQTDRAITAASLLSFSMPSFYLSLLFIMFFSLSLGLFPISGLSSLQKEESGVLPYYLDIAHHLTLPILVIVITSFGSTTLYIRALTLEILKSDYISFALARGADSKKIVTLYILPNLSSQIVTMLGLSLPGIIGGSVILESIFGINGMGLYFYQSVVSRDYPVILGVTMIGAFLTLFGNMAADLLLLRLNPFTKRA